MEVFFFTIILLQLVIATTLFRTLVHPIVILKAASAVSVFILIFYSRIWELSISIETIFIFSSGLLWFDLGFSSMRFIKGKINRKRAVTKEINNEYFSAYKALLIVLLQIIIVILFVKLGSGHLNYSSGIEGFSSSLMHLKQARKIGEAQTIGMLQYAITASTIIGIVYTYISWREWTENRLNKRLVIFILPIILTLFIFFVTGRRSFLLNVMVALMMFFYEQYLREKENKQIDLNFYIKYASFGTILLFGFYMFFSSLGTLFLKGVTNSRSALDTFALYLSGGLVGFDQVYKSYIQTSKVFGQNIFRIVYKILNVLPGANFPANETITTSIYAGNNFVTNVYTGNLHYMADFGYLGVIIANIGIGMFYGYLYTKAKNESEVKFWNVIYAFFITSLLTYTGSESFYLPMTLNLQYFILFFVLLKTPLLKKYI